MIVCAGRAALVALLIGIASIGKASDDSLIAAGQTIYRTALRVDGTPVGATVQGDVPLPPGTGACSSCHRRSGIGFSEGGTARSLNLTAPALFSPREAPPRRPAYDDISLLTAMVSGVAADGRVLDKLMPRYQLTAEDARALLAYLHTLGGSPSPGVTDTTLKIVSILSDDTPAATRQAIETVLYRFVEIKNSDTRRENDRAAAARRHEYGRNYQRAHREWDFSIWNLSGPSASWRAQLESFYADDTPFVVVSGSTGHDWTTVHDFCEQKALPCILPIVDSPPVDAGAFYPLYYSAGVTLEAQVTARHIQNRKSELLTAGTLVVYVDTEAGRTAQSAFSALANDAGIDVSFIALPPGKQPSTRDWLQLLNARRPGILVAWLDDRALQGLMGMADSSQLPELIYTSERFSPFAATSVQPDVARRIRHVFPYNLPDSGPVSYPREASWLSVRGMDNLDVIPASQALFAAHIVGEALSYIKTNFSRDYLLEALEHGLDGTQMTSLYPNTTIGPGQRFISPGAFVTRIGAANQAERFVDTVWIQP